MKQRQRKHRRYTRASLKIRAKRALVAWGRNMVNDTFALAMRGELPGQRAAVLDWSVPSAP